MKLIEKKKNGTVTLNVGPLSLVLFVVLACAKLIGLISWDWLTVVLVSAIPPLFVLGVLVIGVVLIGVAFVVAVITNGRFPKIKITNKAENK